jgi:amino acid adenylation domain-containing protein
MKPGEHSMSKHNTEAIYALSPMQQGMLFHSLYAPDSGVYFEQLACTLQGHLDYAAFEQAWQYVINRHTVLRTAFTWKSLEKMFQIVYREISISIDQHDWRALDTDEQQRRWSELLYGDRQRGFNVSRAPLLRLALVQIAETTHYFVWSHHHALLDGWSLPIVLHDVLHAYEEFRQGHTPMQPPTRPYRDYITWLQQQDMAQAEAFWRTMLRGITTPTPFGVERAPTGEQGYHEHTLHVSEATTNALQTMARQHTVTLNTLVQGAWAILLSRYSGMTDVVFGATVAGRPADLAGVETMVGLFINTLPLRVRVTPEMPLLEWLQALQAQQVELRQYEYTPLVDIQRWSEVPPGVSLFESILVFENYPVDAALREQSGSLTFTDVSSFEHTNYPLTVVAGLEEGLVLKISYDAQRFAADTIERMLGHLHTLLSSIAANPQQRLGSLPLLTDAERHHLLIACNDTARDLPIDQCIHHLIDEQAARAPEAVALICEDNALSYAELTRRANQLAHYLQQRGVGPDVLVGISVERSIEMIVGILGILKAGGAFLPLDPAYPPERLAFMLQDTQAPILLTQTHLVGQLPAHSGQTIYLDTDWETIAQQPDTAPARVATSRNLAYCIYTSGSTGQPKGVLIEQRSLCNTIWNKIDIFELVPGSRMLQFAAFSFDASVAEIFSTLVSGATLVLTPAVPMGEALTDVLRAHRITVVILPPSLLAVLSADDLPALKTLVSAGERCPWEIAERWAMGRRFLNGYGPTETTIGPCVYTYTGPMPEAGSVPIGRQPFANMQLYILDTQQQPVPIGVPGELYIGGVQLARGYLNRPELTAERFVPNPFRAAVGARMYKTGDLVRRLPDDSIEFLGRIDQQVKLRGFRIELGEIEAVLAQHPTVADAVVLVREDQPDEPRLVAYMVAAAGQEVVPSDLRAFLRGHLPTHMIPAAFVVLEAFPLTPSNKVDRKALPAPDHTELSATTTYVPPRTPVEELIVGIWEEILQVQHVGIYDNFFDLGGHSLLATRVVSRVRQVFQLDLPLRDVFEAPTVAALTEKVAAALHDEPEHDVLPLEPTDRSRPLPLSFAQQRLWFLDQLEPESALYNIPVVIRLHGTLNHSWLAQSIETIIARHEILRTTCVTVDSTPVQVIAPPQEWSLDIEDLTSLPDPEQSALRRAEEESRQPFDLAQGPLLRVRLWQISGDAYILSMTMHHIISDEWSIQILLQEIATLYTSYAQEQTALLPPLPIQYADFAYWQRQWLQGELLEQQLAYWKTQLGHNLPVLSLPTDRPRPTVQTSAGALENFSLPPELLTQLSHLSRREGVTLFMTLLAAFQVLLARYSGQDDIPVGTPIANRTRREVEHLIGFFVNTLVLRADLSGNPTFRDVLQQVRQTALAAYAHQDVPFEMLVEVLQPVRDLSHTPLFQVAFAFQSDELALPDLPGLTIDALPIDNGIAKVDMMLTMFEENGQLGGAIEYNTDLFDAATIRRMAEHLHILLAGITADPKQPIGALPLLSDAERYRLLVGWNMTAAPFPASSTFPDLFAHHVAQNSEAIAAVFAETHLTYTELDTRANQLAHYLQETGIGPDALVGVCLERSLDLIVAVLGTLKAGGAFLPLDPAYPPERLAFMLQDAQAPVLLTQAHLIESLPAHSAQVIALDTDWETIAQQPTTAPANAATADNLAYCIYTSGSTGLPKGTLLAHRGLCNLATFQREHFALEAGKRVLQFSALSFDAAVWEIAMALGSGATLVLADRTVLADPPALTRLLHEAAITHVTLPPTMLRLLEPEHMPLLEQVITAGEACSYELVQRWAPGRTFYNAYGPTETTVCASIYTCDPAEPTAPPIGRPLPNMQLYVLDAQQQPVPVGVPGELYVGGVSVARGYLNRPELTAERFLPDPFSSEPGMRLYRTGDRVRYRADGNLEFLGRIDQQVKLRGFRIELGEIEAVLAQHPTVADAVVLVREDQPDEPRLVAYMVAAAGQEVVPSDLRAFLQGHLPAHMIPAAFVVLEAFPLTPSNKVDRKALPAPDHTVAESIPYAPPRTELEEQLAEMCAQLLQLERVGIHNNFFELGGHSLLAARYASHIRESFGIDLPLRTIFEHATVAELAAEIDLLRAANQEKEQQIAEVLAQIENLSDEEVLGMLRDK